MTRWALTWQMTPSASVTDPWHITLFHFPLRAIWFLLTTLLVQWLYFQRWRCFVSHPLSIGCIDLGKHCVDYFCNQRINILKLGQLSQLFLKHTKALFQDWVLLLHFLNPSLLLIQLNLENPRGFHQQDVFSFELLILVDQVLEILNLLDFSLRLELDHIVNLPFLFVLFILVEYLLDWVLEVRWLRPFLLQGHFLLELVLDLAFFDLDVLSEH